MLWLWGSTFSRLLDGNPIEVDGSYAGGNEKMEAGAGAAAGVASLVLKVFWWSQARKQC